MGSKFWAKATADAFGMLQQKESGEVAKPAWWNDEGLKALSARVVRAAPNDLSAIRMRAIVLRGQCAVWEAVPRSAVELKKAAVHFERLVVLCNAPAQKAHFAGDADCCRRQAGAT